MNVKTINNVLSFAISSSPRGEQSDVTDSDEARICVCKQAAIKTISDGLYTPHVHTNNVQNSAFEQSIANT